MPVLVSDEGFGPVTLPGKGKAMDIDPTDVVDFESILSQSAELIRVRFGSFSDGRGFSVARTLRDRGFPGQIRAFGSLLPDQYAMARRCGFDAVEISDETARRFPETDWEFRANWAAYDHQSRFRAAV